VEAELVEQLGEGGVLLPAQGPANPQRVRFFLFRYVSGSTDDHDQEIEEARWMPLAEAAEKLTYAGEREMAAPRTIQGAGGPIGCPHRAGAQFLLGGVRRPAEEGPQNGHNSARRQVPQIPQEQVVLVTIGYQHSPAREDLRGRGRQVEVKRIKELSPRDIEHDNPEFRRTEEMIHFLEQIYGRKVELDDTVTVVRFSQIVDSPSELSDRLRGIAE